MALNIEFKGIASGFEKVKAQIHNVFESIKKEKSVAGGLFKGLFGSAAGTNMLLGLQMAGRAVGGLINIVQDAFSALRNLADSFDQIAKSARRTGVSFETFQQLTFVAKISGATFENVERTFRTFQQRLLDLRLGNVAKLNTLVKALGIDAKKLETMNPFQAFMYTFGKINEIADPNMKRAAAQAFGGRGGTQTLPMIENFKQIASVFNDLDLQIRGNVLAAAEDFDDQLLILNLQIQKITSEFALLEKAADSLRVVIAAIQVFVRGKFGGSLLPGLGSENASNAMNAIQWIGNPITKAFMNYIGDTKDALLGYSYGVNPKLNQRGEGTRGFDLSNAAATGSSFATARSAFNNMGGFMTAGMLASGTADPVYTELKIQTEILRNIEKHTMKTKDGVEWTVVDKFEPGKMIHSGGK